MSAWELAWSVCSEHTLFMPAEGWWVIHLVLFRSAGGGGGKEDTRLLIAPLCSYVAYVLNSLNAWLLQSLIPSPCTMTAFYSISMCLLRCFFLYVDSMFIHWHVLVMCVDVECLTYGLCVCVGVMVVFRGQRDKFPRMINLRRNLATETITLNKWLLPIFALQVIHRTPLCFKLVMSYISLCFSHFYQLASVFSVTALPQPLDSDSVCRIYD